MKTVLREAKFKWLKQHGYSILAEYDNGWTATNRAIGIELHITDEKLTVNNTGAEVTGWLEIDINAFKLLTVSLHIIQLTSEERNEMQLLFNDHYINDFTNQLS